MSLDMTPQLSCENLSKTFNGVQAVTAVSLEINRPGIIGLIGPNGAGKTTLLDLFTGFLTSDSGSWQVCGHDVTGLSPEEIVARGMVRSFQHPHLVPGLSVLENMLLAAPIPQTESFLGAFWTRASDKAIEERERSRSKSLLQWAGLSAHTDSQASALSYGQRKLLALCCCLSTGARVLLLDEPVAGVHPAMVADIVSRIQQLEAEKYLVVVIEHNLDAIRDMAQRLLVMDRGRIIADGPTADVLSRQEVHDAYLR